MEQNVSTETASAVPVPESAKEKTPVSNKLTLFVLGVLCFIFFLSTAFLGYQNYQLNRQIVTLKVTPSPQVTPASSATPLASGELQTYTSERVVDFFDPFTISYPLTWALTETRHVEADFGALSVELKKGDYKITVVQGAGGGGQCYYPGDTINGEMYGKYGPFKEFSKNLLSWRRAQLLGSNEYSVKVCQKGSDGQEYLDSTKVGWINLTGPKEDGEILNEFDQIIESLEVLN